MEVFPSSSLGPTESPNPASGADLHVPPAAGYGHLGPGSDVISNQSPGDYASTGNPVHRSVHNSVGSSVAAIVTGVLCAGLLIGIANAGGVWPRFADLFSAPPEAAPLRASQNLAGLDRLQPQKQAETLLELAVASPGDNRPDAASPAAAMSQISSRVGRWQGRLDWNPEIAALTTAALNSSDLRVRQSGVEVQLAAYGLQKNSATLNSLLRRAASSDHSQKIWALWALGLMANRGFETARVVPVLVAHLEGPEKDRDEDSRRWAVEALAVSGSSAALPGLLTALHTDPSPSVREAAACSLAQSGLFTDEQRIAAVPQLIHFTEDPALDPQTRTWTFQALSEIAHVRLPDDSSAWRQWYEQQGYAGQQ
jgi:HEAT repeats